MTGDFPACLAAVLQWEGGFVDDPRDPGAATNLGVTTAALSDWLGHPATADQIKALTPTDVAPLYRSRYWMAAGADHLPPGADLIVFDGAVNMGVGTSARLLQRACGAYPDGHVGDKTIAAAEAMPARALIAAIAKLREERYRALAGFPDFGTGWLRRLADIAAKAQDMADNGT